MPVLMVAFEPSATSSPDDATAIIVRSVVANEADWRAELKFDHCERDDDGGSSKTYDVTMIDGTPYERLVAIDDRPLSSDAHQSEQQNLDREVADRRAESPAERRERIDTYTKRHERVGTLFRELANAFVFTLEGTHTIRGRTAYIINAKPRRDYEPATRDARALKGVRARFWIDSMSYHWIKLTAQVTMPVSLFGVFVRVEPGTTVELEKAPPMETCG